MSPGRRAAATAHLTGASHRESGRAGGVPERSGSSPGGTARSRGDVGAHTPAWIRRAPRAPARCASPACGRRWRSQGPWVLAPFKRYRAGQGARCFPTCNSYCNSAPHRRTGSRRCRHRCVHTDISAPADPRCSSGNAADMWCLDTATDRRSRPHGGFRPRLGPWCPVIDPPRVAATGDLWGIQWTAGSGRERSATARAGRPDMNSLASATARQSRFGG